MIRLLVCVLISSSCTAQTSEFRRMCAEFAHMVDTSYEVNQASISDSEYDFTSEGIEPLTSKVLSFLHKKANTKKTPFQQSEVLTRMAASATKAWYGSQYTDRSKWKRLEKYIRRSKHTVTTNFNILTSLSFRINLMHVPRNDFYYDRKGPEGELNLYLGQRPKTEEEKEAEPVPVPFLTEKAILKRIERELSRKGALRAIKKGIYSYVGISIVVDQKSLYKERMPTARVVIFLGAKRLQRLKIKK